MFSKITHTYSASFQAQESFFSLLSMDGNGQTLKLSSSMQCWNTWNCYPLSTLLSNALPQANLHNWMVQIVWNNSQMLPSSLQCVTYSALQEKIKTIAKFKPQLKYKVSSGNTFHNISPIKSPGNIQKKILNTSYTLKQVWTKKKKKHKQGSLKNEIAKQERDGQIKNIHLENGIQLLKSAETQKLFFLLWDTEKLQIEYTRFFTLSYFVC